MHEFEFHVSGEAAPVFVVDYLGIGMGYNVSEGVLFFVADITGGDFFDSVFFMEVEDMINGLVLVLKGFPPAFDDMVKGWYVVALEVFGCLTEYAHSCFVSEDPFVVDYRAAYSVFHPFKKIVTHVCLIIHTGQGIYMQK